MSSFANIKYGICIVSSVLLLNLSASAQASSADTSDIIAQYRSGQAYWPPATIEAGVSHQPLRAIGTPPTAPADNPITDAKRELGKHLFFDRRLSASKQIACASCHDPDLGWADGRKTSIGHNRQQGLINAPTVVNSAWLTDVFWDGRVQSLEEQVIASWTNPIEMAADTQRISSELQNTQSYPDLFVRAFGTHSITELRVAQAIATFMRTLNMTSTPFDQFMAGDTAALSDEAIQGLHLFRTKARCINCHHGEQLSDSGYHHLGTSFHNFGDFQGRYRFTQQPEDVGAFRTPSLRGAAATAPFMHNGFVADLDALLSMYNMGWWQNAELEDKGNDIPTARLSPLIKPLDLTPVELLALKSFILSLNGGMPWMAMPQELP